MNPEAESRVTQMYYAMQRMEDALERVDEHASGEWRFQLLALIIAMAVVDICFNEVMKRLNEIEKRLDKRS